MEIYKCDRCGAIEDVDRMDITIGNYESENHDLCNECYEQIISFIQGKEQS